MPAQTQTGTLTNVGDTVTLSATAGASVLVKFSGTYAGAVVGLQTAIHSDSAYGGVNAGALGLTGTSSPLGCGPSPQAALATNATVLYTAGGLVPGCDFQVILLAIGTGTVNVSIFG